MTLFRIRKPFHCFLYCIGFDLTCCRSKLRRKCCSYRDIVLTVLSNMFNLFQVP